jgi:primosomal protein N' (replication factor Y)
MTGKFIKYLYFKIIKITLKHRDFDKLKEGSMWLYQVMTQNLNIPVLGPEPINRIRNEYIRTIIKIPINTSIVSTKDRFKNVEQF